MPWRYKLTHELVCLFVCLLFFCGFFIFSYFPFSSNFHFSLLPSFHAHTPQANNLYDPMKRIISNVCKWIAIAIVAIGNNNNKNATHNFRKISFHTCLDLVFYIDFDTFFLFVCLFVLVSKSGLLIKLASIKHKNV